MATWAWAPATGETCGQGFWMTNSYYLTFLDAFMAHVFAQRCQADVQAMALVPARAGTPALLLGSANGPGQFHWAKDHGPGPLDLAQWSQHGSLGVANELGPSGCRLNGRDILLYGQGCSPGDAT